MSASNIKDQTIINEVVSRLIQRIKDNLGLDLDYGSFIFHIHDGVCTKVDFSHKDKIYTRPQVKEMGVSKWKM